MDLAPAVAAVRAFNRAYTRVIGVLDEGLLHSPYSLTEVRVLFELAHSVDASGAQAARIREDLGLDAGYLSRILSRFEAEGLAVRSRSAEDGRRATVVLTERGRAVFSGLDDRSGEQIATLLSSISQGDRERLVEAMARIGTLLGLDSGVGMDRKSTGAVLSGGGGGGGGGGGTGGRDAVTLRAPKPGDLGWVVERHGALYATEYNFDPSFEALVSRIVADYAASHDPVREAFWIAEAAGQRAGSIACVRKETDDGIETAQLRLLLVDPVVRGLGVGGRLVDECVAFARAAGYRRIVLYTVDLLHAARRQYERAGFRLVQQAARSMWGHTLVEQDWVLELGAGV